VIKWAASENNLVTDLLKVLLVESDDVANLGMEIRVDEMDFVSMLSHMYRQDIYGMGGETDFGEPYYSMFNLATGWESALQDYSFRWSGEDAYVKAGYNSNYLFDLGQGGLDQLSMAMVYGVAEGDRNGYLEAWQDYILRYNELLPDLPLYSDRYATVHVSWLRDYDQDTFWGFQNAILYATVDG
jgi:peptide/nickel transport system substrate-binding protein